MLEITGCEDIKIPTSVIK